MKPYKILEVKNAVVKSVYYVRETAVLLPFIA